MRIRVMVATGAALVAIGGTAAAAHATGPAPVPAAKAPAVAVSRTSDDRGRHVEPGDDRGGDDHGRGRGGDEGPRHH
jgi:hypothetical protein